SFPKAHSSCLGTTATTAPTPAIGDSYRRKTLLAAPWSSTGLYCDRLPPPRAGFRLINFRVWHTTLLTCCTTCAGTACCGPCNNKKMHAWQVAPDFKGRVHLAA